MEEKEQIFSGIPGLDNIIKGGILKNSSVLIVGAPGTGKSIATMQFIYEGAKKGEAGLYITSEENAAALRIHASSLGWDLKKFEDKHLFTIYEQPIDDRRIATIEVPLSLIKSKKIKRVAVDSITLFRYLYSSDIQEFRRGLLRFIGTMIKSGVTLFATSERSSTDFDSFTYQTEDYLFNGLIILSKIRKGSSFERVMHVAKMRGQEHLLDVFPFTINKGGMTIHTKQLPFSLIEQDFTKLVVKK
ncbi:hypothetical protein HY643_04520 [Candidatus Woesearchaeota archaeon]|nr:hypothetical protein [Candidatus Woesearchaeota archaeon]